MEINWTEVILNIAWVVVVMVLIPLTKKGLSNILPIIVEFLKGKMSAETWNVLASILQDLITSAEKNIKGEKKGKKKKEHVMNLLKEQGLLTDDNYNMVSEMIDGICERLTMEGLINVDYWKELIEETKQSGL